MQDIISKNFGWKLLSLALAAAIWVAVKGISTERGNQSERAFIALPIHIVSGTADVRTFNIEPAEARVTVKGRPELVGALAAREIHVMVDVSGADTEQDFPRRVEVALPNGIAAIQIEPQQVQVIVPPRGPARFPSTKP
jgi:hypothetical protein